MYSKDFLENIKKIKIEKFADEIKNYPVAIQCNTFEEAKKLFEIFDDWKIKWYNNKKIYHYDDLQWSEYKENTCYTLFDGYEMKFDGISHFHYEVRDEVFDDNMYSKILTFSEFKNRYDIIIK